MVSEEFQVLGFWFCFRTWFHTARSFLSFLRALLVEAGFDFFGVALVVEGEEAVEDGAAGGLAQRVALALLGGVEAVAQVEIAPAVGGNAPYWDEEHHSIMGKLFSRFWTSLSACPACSQQACPMRLPEMLHSPNDRTDPQNRPMLASTRWEVFVEKREIRF